MTGSTITTTNSIESYIDLVDSGELGEKSAIVFEYIKNHPDQTYNEIAQGLGMQHNSCTSRIKELRDRGLVVIGGTVVNPLTGKSNAIYHVRRPDEEPDIIVPQSYQMAIPTQVQNAVVNARSHPHEKMHFGKGDNQYLVWSDQNIIYFRCNFFALTISECYIADGMLKMIGEGFRLKLRLK